MTESERERERLDAMGQRILNRIAHEYPHLFAASRMPRYRYYEADQRMFCWNTEPFSGDHPWRAFEYAPTGPGSRTGNAKEWKSVRSVNCATRTAAKARALKWYNAYRKA